MNTISNRLVRMEKSSFLVILPGPFYLWDADTKQELSLSGMDYNSKEYPYNTRAIISPDSQTLASWQEKTKI